jgi:prepilin-type processing-associated H-X9-DG protein
MDSKVMQRPPTSWKNATSWRRSPRDRSGITPAEVVVVLVLLALFVLVMLLVLPRQRENARLAGCRRNLMQIGVAISLYDRMEGALPTVPPLGTGVAGRGPLRTLLEALELPDFSGLSQGTTPKPIPGSVPGERPVPGFVCPSDPNATSRLHPAPISYRATTGDLPEGVNGGFAPGRRVRLSEIEAGDGLSFTAAFAERLVGNARDGEMSPVNYAVVPPPLSEGGCGALSASSYHGDAGALWLEASWRSTLYNHTMTPNSATSCVTSDGRSAHMVASSGHIPGVNVLMFDGSVRTVKPSISLEVWKAMATTHSSPTPERQAPRPNEPIRADSAP